MYRSFVIKIGTSSWIHEEKGIQEKVLKTLLNQIKILKKNKIQCVLVVSGAISCGEIILNKKRTSQRSLPEKQALAAVGQIHLMNVFEKEMKQFELNCGQILLSADDFHNRERYLNIRHTLHYLLSKDIIPVINENDTVTIDELRFGDNDHLASMISGLLRSEYLVFLSQVEGLINYKTQTIIQQVDHVNQALSFIKNHTSTSGTGGMKSKLSSAQKASSMGTNCLIGSSHHPSILTDILKGEYQGTFIPAQKNKFTSKKSWLAFSRRTEGRVWIDEGAYQALLKGGSLLPSGIKNFEGYFQKGDLVIILYQNKNIGKGLVNCSYLDLPLWISKKALTQDYDEVIHRDNFVFLHSYSV